jgi:spore germination protein YaaH
MTVLFLLRCGPSPAEGEKPSRWGYLVYSSATGGRYLEKALPGYAVVSPTGFRLESPVTITPVSPDLLQRLTSLSKRHGFAIYPLISFSSTARGRGILASEESREKAARTISDLAHSGGFPGVHLDFEYLPPEDAERLALLLKRIRMHYRGRITMAIFPQVDFPEKWSRFHDLSKIGNLIDEAVIMCYDYHGPHGSPGPVTDISWAEENIRHCLRFMKPEQVWLGIPAYGYLWCGGKPEAISAKRGAPLARARGATRDPSGTLSALLRRGNRTCRLYVADATTRSLLADLARRYRLKGTALWRIGFED